MSEQVAHLSADKIQQERKDIEALLTKWQRAKTDADKNIEYWQRQLDAITSVQARYLFANKEPNHE